MTKKALIVGGGISGLTIAWYLTKNNIKTTVIEKEKELGGLAAPIKISEGFVERTYHLIFKGDKDTENLCKALGIDIIWKKTRIGICENRTIYDISTALSTLLTFKPLSFVDRILFLKAIFEVANIKDWKKLDGKDLEEWALEKTNNEVFKTVWEPLIWKKFYNKTKNVSLAWFWGKTVHRAKSRPRMPLLSFLPNPFTLEEFGYIKGSFRTLYAKLEEEILSNGGEVIKACRAQEIAVSGNRIDKVKYAGKWHEVDLLVSTIPYPELYKLIKSDLFLPEIKDRKYVGAIGVIFSYPTKIGNMCWVNVNDRDTPLVVTIEITNLVGVQEFGGNSVTYLYSYLPQDNEQFSLSDKELFESYCCQFKTMHKTFDANKVIEYKVIKSKYADPIPSLNFAETLPPLNSRLRNFYLCDFTSVYPYDKGSNRGIHIAKKISDIILKDVRK